MTLSFSYLIFLMGGSLIHDLADCTLVLVDLENSYQKELLTSHVVSGLLFLEAWMSSWWFYLRVSLVNIFLHHKNIKMFTSYSNFCKFHNVFPNLLSLSIKTPLEILTQYTKKTFFKSIVLNWAFLNIAFEATKMQKHQKQKTLAIKFMKQVSHCLS